MKPLSLFTRLAALAVLLTGCSKSPDQASPDSPSGHAHISPHGGTLVPLGEHGYNLELVRDADAGKLSAYVLDSHAENFVRISAPSFELVAISGGERRPLTLRAVADSATGETVGDTSHFEAQADWLKRTAQFPGTITALEIRGTKFENVAIYLSK
jgi:hypothetical protein